MTDSLLVEAIDKVTIVTLNRPPHNFLDTLYLRDIADAVDEAQNHANCVVIRSEGRNFSAGRDFSKPRDLNDQPEDLYYEAERLFARKVPMIAVVGGAAIGAGLGLALSADLRIGTPTTRFEAPFAKLGTRQGFGITRTLAEVVGAQTAKRMLLTGQAMHGEQAHRCGLLDVLAADPASALDEAVALAQRIASYSDVAVEIIRQSQTEQLVRELPSVFASEAADQAALRNEKRPEG